VNGKLPFDVSKNAKAQRKDSIERTSNGDVTATREERVEFRVFPSPEELAQYDVILPGAADRLLKTYESQVDHRQYLEKKVVESGIGARSAGLAAGFVVAIAFLAASVYLIATGKEVAGTIIGTVDLVALVSVFVLGRSMQRAERAEKSQQLPESNRK
jgi:uncharacterized membrane protein